MEKDFTTWSSFKNDLDKKRIEHKIYCQTREIWICSLGLNIGSEQDGNGTRFSRPVLIHTMPGPFTLWVIPLTTKIHTDDFHVCFNLGGVDQYADISQIRTISVKRLDRKVAMIPVSIYNLITKYLIRIICKNEIPLSGEISEAKAVVN